MSSYSDDNDPDDIEESGSLETVTVQPADLGARLDALLAERLGGHSRSRLKALIKQGQVRLGGCTIEEPNRRVKPGEVYKIALPAPEAPIPKPEAIPLDIAYEDEDVIVVDKPAGLVVHPAAGHWHGTLVNALIQHCGDSLSGIGGVRRPGIVHRLDKDTSGLMVVAKNDLAHRALAAQFADHALDGPLTRRYRAFVWGVPDRRSGRIEAAIGRSPANRQKMAVVKEGGKPAITHYRVVQDFGSVDDRAGGWSIAELDCALETGRTHQIRVHLASTRHPLVGDPLYASGWRSKAETLPVSLKRAILGLGRQALHAAVLGFHHPRTGLPLQFVSQLPKDLKALELALRSDFTTQ